ncbi:hypothetical protein [Mixta calida]|uniref:hypothetical protein n=1 Tax=Mixta calida TaxID=665913 RepID=UPI002FDD5FA3
MSEVKRGLRYGENVEWFLNELAAYETGDLSDGGFEVYGEDDQGIEGSCEIDIPELAADAAQLISELRAQLAALTAENVTLKESVEHAGECISAAEFEGLSDALESKDGEKLAELIHRRLCHAHLPVETPATDAAANALRAEGVEMLAEQCDGYALNHVYTYTKRHAKEFAQQLREGK